jgi:hypothetical protein
MTRKERKNYGIESERDRKRNPILIHYKPKTEKASKTADAINSAAPNRAIAVTGDILNDAYIEELVTKAAEFGNGKIHVIVNNAGFTWDGVIHKVCKFFFLFGFICQSFLSYFHYFSFFCDLSIS